MFAASKTATPSGGVPDPQFNYVTMLLHGDGTNGAQNNTFVDSSTNNFTITRNGNTTQGSFSPYGSNWSNFFPTDNKYLSVPSNAAFAFGTGDFTVEGWFYQIDDVSYPSALEIGTHTAGGILFITRYGNVGACIYASGFYGANATTFNTWNHIAWVRSSGVLQIYVNGVGSVAAAFTNNLTDTANVTISNKSTFAASYSFNGNISNLRVVKGTAVYTSNFTPSTAPLTAISGTSLLTCQSNRFIDNSSNAFAITVTGTPSVQRFNPFGTSTAYSTSVIGGSGYFDGSGDYLTATLTGQSFGTGNFTAEGWFYQTANVSYNTLMAQRTTGNSATGWIVGSDSGGSVYAYSNGFLIGPTGTAIKNQWNHVAFVRSSGTMTLYLNGVSLGTSATSKTFSDTFAGIGGDGADAYVLSGYASNVRYVVGTAVYTTTFTPPTAPLTAISGTSLLADFTNGAIFDNAMMNDLETIGNAQISTSVVKYGTGSLAFDGTGDYLLSNSATTNLYAFGNGDFTIEFWMYPNIVTGLQVMYDSRPSGVPSSPNQTIYLNGAALRYYVNGSDVIIGANLSISTWYHIVVCRSGTSTKMFINGVQTGSTFTDTVVYTNTTNRPVIGTDSNAITSNFYNGYIDDLRVTKGYARYTANFTPPTAAFSNTGPI
jgi:hypothetical protein